MAIVNRAPDSFSDKGRTFRLDNAIEAARTAIADGADWIDIGGVPCGPGPEVAGRSIEAGADVINVAAAVASVRRGLRRMRLGHVITAGDMLMLRYACAR